MTSTSKKRKTTEKSRGKNGKKRVKTDNDEEEKKLSTVKAVLNERWDVEMLDLCRRSVAFDTSGAPDLTACNSGYLTVQYGYLEGKPQCGRLYALGGCAQHSSGIVRRFCQHQYYHDVDQVNSGPSIVWNLCKKFNIECTTLDSYVHDRDAHLNALMKQCGVEKSVAKNAYQVIVYGGDAKKWLGERGIQIHVATLEAFSNEMHHIRHALMNTDLGQTAQKACSSDANELSIFSYLVFHEENKALMAMKKFFEASGYVVGALVFDGLQVERKSENGGSLLPESLLRDCEESIFKTTNLRLKLTEKSMIPTEQDYKTLYNSPRDLRYERDAAVEVVLHCNKYIVHCTSGIAVFDVDFGTYCIDQHANETMVLPRLLKHLGLCHRFQGNVSSKHFIYQVTQRKNMYDMLKTEIPINDHWLDASIQRQRLKLCFKNGYWDFERHEFVKGHFPEMNFVNGVRADLMERNEQYVNMVLEEIFTRPYSSVAVRDFVLKALARAIAGDQSTKRGYFIIGPSNSGKGLVTRLLEAAFPGVVSQFDAAVLCKEVSNDPAKDFSWVSKVFQQRVIVANEFNAKNKYGQIQRINGNIWKSIVSGGTDKIDCRLLYSNSNQVTPAFTPFILANDMPEFDTPGDSGVKTRTVATYMDRASVAHEPNGPLEFRADPTLMNRIHTREYQNGLVWLLFDYYKRFQDEGHDIPDEVKEATNERISMDGPLAALQDWFAVWDNDTRRQYVIKEPDQLDWSKAVQNGWSVRTKEVYDALKRLQITMSQVEVGKQLKTRDIVKHKTKNDGQVFIGLRSL